MRATSIAAWSGRAVAWCLIAVSLGVLAGRDVLIVTGPAEAIWFGLIGLFLEVVTRQSLHQNRVLRTLRRYRARDLMVANPAVVRPETPLEALPGARGGPLCVEHNGVLAGIIPFAPLPMDALGWAGATAGEAMVPRAELVTTAPDTPLSDVLIEMEAGDHLAVPVFDDGHLIGVVARDRILRVLTDWGLLAPAGA